MLFLVLALTATAATANPFSLGFGGQSLPPFGLPEISPTPEKELELEKITKALAMDKSWPFVASAEKEFTFDKGLEMGKELEFERELGLGKLVGLEKAISIEKAYPGWLYEKYFGQAKKLTFEQALAFELYKEYGYYGLWVARELQRRYAIAKELGLIGREIAIQEAITLGLFKGIGLEKIFEAVNKAIGAEKTFEFEKGFGIFKKSRFF